MPDGQTRVAMLAGASGLTGGHLLDELLGAADFGRVIAVTRRALPREHARLANRIVQFERMETQLRGVTCEVAFCCLGTTIARAGSRDNFREVDVDLVVAFARTALAAHAQRFVVMSSVGADPRSGNFYLRTKGEMEAELEALGFPSLDILQPGVLLGLRREMRPRELAAMALV
ncbi:MAG TPA: NAD(P)H-binding protein, partial [Steroidobacteraceae bacterium]|nr:NAD(P)H-binding protein [Steroidobacteraceae bacterium]